MNLNYRDRISLVAATALPILVSLALVGCSGRDLTELELAGAQVNPVVFADAFLGGLDYAAFENSYYEALTIDEADTYAGTHSLKISIPAGNWAGGSFYSQGPRDLRSFNALTFFAKASQPLQLGSVGIGIGIVSPPDNQAEIGGVSLTQEWRRVILPIPDSSVLGNERGLFWYSHAGGPVPIDIWFDEVEFTNVADITDPRPVMDTATVEALLDEAVPITGAQTTFNVVGEDIEVSHEPAYFTFFSSDEAVVRGGKGVAKAVGGGTATLTAKLGDTDVDGEVTVTVIAPPSIPAPTPALEPGVVISIFSDAYTDITVDTWRTGWSSGSVEVFDQQIQGDNVKAFTGLANLAYVGIEFIADQIDASGMTHFHLDVYAPAGSMIGVKLADFGPNRVYSGGDDTERSLTFQAGSTPAFVPGEWVSLDIPLTNFVGMNFGNVAQLILQSTNIGNVWIDNIYFHR